MKENCSHLFEFVVFFCVLLDGPSKRESTHSLLSYLVRILKKLGLVPRGMFSLKRSTAGASVVPFRVLSRKKNMTVRARL